MLKKSTDGYITIEAPNKYQLDDRSRHYGANRQLTESETAEVLQVLEKIAFVDLAPDKQADTLLNNKLYPLT